MALRRIHSDMRARPKVRPEILAEIHLRPEPKKSGRPVFRHVQHSIVPPENSMSFRSDTVVSSTPTDSRPPAATARESPTPASRAEVLRSTFARFSRAEVSIRSRSPPAVSKSSDMKPDSTATVRVPVVSAPGPSRKNRIPKLTSPTFLLTKNLRRLVTPSDHYILRHQKSRRWRLYGIAEG